MTAPPRLVFDVSALVEHPDARPTGIERVMLEVASVLLDRSSDNVFFCAFEGATQTFTKVSAAGVRDLIARVRGTDDCATDRATAAQSGLPTAQDPLRTSKVDSSSGWGRMAGGVVGAAKDAGKATRAGMADLRTRRRIARSVGSCFSWTWSTKTTYCTIDAAFSGANLDVLLERRERSRFRVVLMMHDVIPSAQPQYAGWNPEATYDKALRLADVVVVNSDATRDDLVRFAGERRLAIPTVVKLPMPSALRDLTTVRPTTLPADVTDGGFVLCVGTITIRKNHQLLFDVWEQLLASRDRGDLPDLVVVGARGWLSEETMSRLTRTPAFKGIVHHLDHATDENVAWLYEHCAFTVYPSLYEGWGLPVSESHDFGKVCLTTNRSSLPEAGEGLAELLDPHDRTLWRETIFRYWTDRTYRDAREADIRQQHRRITAHDSANTILNTITMNNPELS